MIQAMCSNVAHENEFQLLFLKFEFQLFFQKFAFTNDIVHSYITVSDGSARVT